MWTIYFVYADVQYVRDAIYLGINKRLSLQVVWPIGLERISFSCLPRLKLTPFFFLRAKAAPAYGHKESAGPPYTLLGLLQPLIPYGEACT